MDDTAVDEPRKAAALASEKSPAFQLYVKEFLADANQAGMSLMETGAYARLMCFEWNEHGKGIPDDAVRCARMVGATRSQMKGMWQTIRSCFQPHPVVPGRLIHPRLHREREKQEAFRLRQSEKGKQSAANRKATEPQPGLNHGSTEPQPTREGQPEGNSPISDLRSPISDLQNDQKSLEPFDEHWEQFKATYPAKGREGGRMALHFFLDACQSVGFATVMAGLERYCRSKKVRDGYVVGMEKWLEKTMWIQEPEPETTSGDDVAAMQAHLAKIDAERASRGR